MDRVIAVDFDGTLCTNLYPDVGSPKQDIIDKLLSEKQSGSKIILWTCREGELLKEAVNACKYWGIEFDAINENLPERINEYGNNCRKIGADEYWDDRAIQIR